MAGEPDLADWIGTEESRTDALAPTVAAQLAATLPEYGRAAEAVGAGAPLPPLWHWGAFQPHEPMDALGPNGHPKLGRFLPPVPLERRMWAGGRVTFLAPLAVGETLVRRSEIQNVREKTGRAGRMVFVTVGHALHGAGGLALREEQDIVYIARPDRHQPPAPIPAPASPAFDWPVPIDPVRLFRYSAATFNGHRIHYDRPYAVEVEGYPGLLVHAPLQATLLMGAAIQYRGAPPDRFAYRGVHPMFDFHDLRLIGVADGGALDLCTAAPEGHQGLRARAEWDTS
jgi:3-methylfumaryl-CoA hydratase